MNKNFEKILSLVPDGTERVDWASLEASCLAPVFEKMADTMQNLEYHGEGDVYTHTKLVCDALVSLDEYKKLNKESKEAIFIASLLHDIGKIRTTKMVDGALASPRHTIVGASMARELLWSELDLCGSIKDIELREAICTLIRYHSFPPYAIFSENPEIKLLKIASDSELFPLFSLDKLCTLEKADVLGRINDNTNTILERIEYCRMLAMENQCENGSYKFFDDFTKRAYFKGKTSFKDDQLYNDSWGQVIMLSGLPASGKDTFISKNYSNMNVISLDEIRKEIGIPADAKQGPVIALAHERAKELLRKKQPFIWNATSLTSLLRSSQIELFESYGASVKTIYLEAKLDTVLERNKKRQAYVPENVISKMLSKIEPPERYESEQVVYIES